MHNEYPAFPSELQGDKRQILREFKRVLREAEAGTIIYPHYGICWATSYRHATEGSGVNGYEAVRMLSPGWTFHTGRCDYPVPDSGDKWAGLGLMYRISLLKYMIGRLEAQGYLA